MSLCPYTLVRKWISLIPTKLSSGTKAKHLRVRVNRAETTTVDVALPSGSARWLIDLIPQDVMNTIRLEGIPIDQIQNDLASRVQLNQGPIFELVEESRTVLVWLE